ncbi:PREDICTED: uncharacterized protein LOC104814666 isoform X1 [Tarenaya hassleriana]|uniref:uncharacterized protein LOC104814666 isoform X1 n=1 Tax=Tarenaya hassleriana TaxID=28532 RepID=UPI00053C52F6|nr:PREDICTED: uncharacterized protein LOC104814666 isoform X1 [Tarenaya hassleriana]
MADSAKRFVLLFLVVSSIFGEITCMPSSCSGNDDAFPSDGHGCYDPRTQELEELRSRVSALASIFKEREVELLSKEETIQRMETTIREKSDKISQLQSEIDFIESASSVKRKGKAEEQVYQLEKQIFKLKREAEAQNKRRLELETRTEVAERRVVELNSKLENLLKVNVEQKQRIHNTEFSLKSAEERLSKVESFAVSSYKKFIEVNWEKLSDKFDFHSSQARAYLMTRWSEYLRPTLSTTVQKASKKMDEVRKWSEPHIQTLNNKWVPHIKDMWLTCAIYLEPKIQSLTQKSVEVYHMSKQALSPYLVQAMDTTYDYFQVAKRHTQPYTTRVVTVAKPHWDKAHVAFEPYAEKMRHAFTKLLNSTAVYHQQAQEMLKNNELTKPVATVDLAWFVATALLGLPLIFVIKFLSAISNTKPKRNSHKHHHGSNGHRRAKRRHPYY